MKNTLMHLPLLCFFAGGCESPPRPPPQGIAVGNPPGMAALRAMPAAADHIEFTALQIDVASVYLEDCTGVGSTVTSGLTLDLDGSAIEIQPGTWCAIGLLPSGPILLEGTASNGGRFSFDAEIGRLMVYGEIVVEEAEPDAEDPETGAYVLELGDPDWISQTRLGLGPTDELELGADCLDDPICAALWTAIMHRSAIYRDDGDGEVSKNERTDGHKASGSGRRE